MEPQLQRLYESGLRSFEATVASGRSFVRAGQQCRLRLPDGSQANFIAQTDINASRVQVLITDRGEGLAWCLSAGQVTDSRLLDLRRERPLVKTNGDGRDRKIAMVLDANWCYDIGSQGPPPQDNPANIAFLQFLTQNASRIISPPIDARFEFFNNTHYSPFGTIGAELAAAAELSVVQVSLNENAEGFIWMPLLTPGERFNSVELQAIQRCARDFGAIILGDASVWGGGDSYNSHLIDLFQPEFSVTSNSTLGDRRDIETDQGTVIAALPGFWDSTVDIPADRIIGTLKPRSEAFGKASDGRPAAIWLD